MSFGTVAIIRCDFLGVSTVGVTWEFVHIDSNLVTGQLSDWVGGGRVRGHLHSSR